MSVRGNSLTDFELSTSQVIGAGVATLKAAIRHPISWQNGTGANAINQAATRAYTLAGSAITVNLDADFADLAGSAIVFTGMKDVVFHAPAANTGDITINFGIANGWDSAFTGTAILKPNTSVRVLTGNATAYAVTAGTGDLISFSGTSGDKLEIGVGGVA